MPSAILSDAMTQYRQPLLTQIPAEIVAVRDYERYAQARLDDNAWAYFSGGAADERALQRNIAAFQRYELLPAVLNDLRGGNTSLNLFGRERPYPILLAPVAYQRLAHPDGEAATVLAASAMQATAVVSMQSSCDVQMLAQQAHEPLWFQWYWQADQAASQDLLRRIEAAGFEAIVLTADAPVNGIRNREQRAGFFLPSGVEAVNLRGFVQPSVAPGEPGTSPVFGSGLLHSAATWDALAWLASNTSLPVLVKGVLRPQDAVKAVSLGAQGIIVSNHGGRTLDAITTPLRMLPEITDAVGHNVPVLMDGGIRRGTDILIALALGATAVLVGRPYIFALAAAGAAGVAHVLHILRTELEVAMALCGCATLADIGPDLLLEA